MQIHWNDIWREFQTDTGYKRKEIAAFLGLNVNTIGHWYDCGTIPWERHHKKIKILYLNLVCKVSVGEYGNLIIKSPIGNFRVIDGDVNGCISDLADMLLVLRKAA